MLVSKFAILGILLQWRLTNDGFFTVPHPHPPYFRYVHNQDWDSAQRVAEENDPDSVTDVLVGQVLFIRCFDRLKRGSIEVFGYLTTYPFRK